MPRPDSACALYRNHAGTLWGRGLAGLHEKGILRRVHLSNHHEMTEAAGQQVPGMPNLHIIFLSSIIEPKFFLQRPQPVMCYCPLMSPAYMAELNIVRRSQLLNLSRDSLC